MRRGQKTLTPTLSLRKLRERVGERMQTGLLKSPLVKILLLCQCVRVSGSGAQTLTLTLALTLSLVRERASMSPRLSNSMRAIFTLQPVFRQSHPGEGRPRAEGKLHLLERIDSLLVVGEAPLFPSPTFSCGRGQGEGSDTSSTYSATRREGRGKRPRVQQAPANGR